MVRVLSPGARVRARGKFLVAGESKLHLRGVTYGPFRPGPQGEYGQRERVAADFRQMCHAGINTVRVYTVPPPWMLDLAAEHGLRVLAGVPWAQHLPFLEDRSLARDAVARVRDAAAACKGHPGLLGLAVGNEIPAGVVRWYGHRRIEAFLRRLCGTARDVDPELLLTYVNYPSTEYLDLSFLDLVCFNVFLEDQGTLARYLARLQHLSVDLPLVLTEVGLDSIRHGEGRQAWSVAQQVRTALAAGCAGVCVFAWTDEWHRGGNDIDDWAFGLTDRERRPKPALAAVGRLFREPPPLAGHDAPKVSVAVCTYNGARTLRRCLEALERLEYPEYEVIVVDDGSTDDSAAIAADFRVRLIRTPNRGLSAARNTALEAARGRVIAYIDDDAYADPHWLQYLVATLRSGHAGAGGPNLPVPGDSAVAACVSCVPGIPTHVLLSDTVAEHVPGCNMAFWVDALREIGGFDPQFRIAGDDVDVCWRLQQRGGTLGFSPAAVVMHHRRGRVRQFWRQQLNYGRAEAMLERKWPEKYNAIGHATWTGRVYGHGVPATLLLHRQRIYHGVWGTALFQYVYPGAKTVLRAVPAMPEWHALMAGLAGLAALGVVWPAMLVFLPVVAAMAAFALVQAAAHGWRARLVERPRSRTEAFRLRALIAALYLMQPVARCLGRTTYGLTPWRLRGIRGFARPRTARIERWVRRWRDPAERLAALEERLRRGGAVVMRGHEFARWDLELRGGLLGRIRVSQFTADLAHGAQLVRLYAAPRVAGLGVLLLVLLAIVGAGAAAQRLPVVAGIAWGSAALLALLAVRELGAAMATFLVAADADQET